jgi:hypothetical protein
MEKFRFGPYERADEERFRQLEIKAEQWVKSQQLRRYMRQLKILPLIQSVRKI